MALIDDLMARLTAELDACPAIVPAVRTYILNSDWPARGAAELQNFLDGPLAIAIEIMNACMNESPSFREFAVDLAQPGALEASLPKVDIGATDLIDRLAATVSLEKESIRHQYYVLLLLVLCDSRGHENGVIDSHNLILSQLNLRCFWLCARNRPGDAIAVYERHLQLHRSDYGLGSYDALERSLERRGTVAPYCRLEFYFRFADAHLQAGNYEHALAIVDAFFCIRQTDFHDPLRLEALVWNRIDEIHNWLREDSTNAKGTGPAAVNIMRFETVFSHDFLCRLALIMRRAAYRLVTEEKLSDLGALRLRRDMFLDAVVGIRLGKTMHFKHLQSLAGCLKIKTLMQLLNDWVWTLDAREHVDQMASALLLEIATARTGQDVSDWWHLPFAEARTAVAIALATHLSATRSHQRARELLVQFVAPQSAFDGDFADIMRAAPSLQARKIAMYISFRTAFLLFETGDLENVVDFLESFLEISGAASYGTDGFRDRFLTVCFPDGECDGLAAATYCMLVLSLVTLNRASAALCVIEVFFSAQDEDDFLDFGQFRAACELEPNLRDMIVGCVLATLFEVGRYEWLRRWMEHLWGLPDVVQTAAPRLTERFRVVFSAPEVMNSGGLLGLMDLPSVVQGAHGQAQAIRVAECMLGIYGVSNDRLADVYKDGDFIGWFRLLSRLVPLLVDRRHFQRALTLVSLLSQSEADASQNRLGFQERLRNADDATVLETRFLMPLLISAILAALRATGRIVEARVIVEQELPDPEWLDEQKNPFGGLGVTFLANECLRVMAGYNDDYVDSLTFNLVWHLRQNLTQGAQTGNDRVRVANATMESRQILNEIGYSKLVAEHEIITRYHRIRHLEWDTEFGQRALMERFLKGLPQTELGQGMSLKKGSPHPGAVVGVMAQRILDERQAANEAPAVQLSQIPPSNEPLSQAVVYRQPIQVNEEFWQAQVQSLRWGVNEKDLARSLDRGTALLRAGFTTSGQLAWTLYRSCEDKLAIVSHDQGSGAADARQRILAAVELFELTVACVWDNRGLKADKGIEGCSDAVDALCWQLRYPSQGLLPPHRVHKNIAGLENALRNFPGLRQCLLQKFGKSEEWNGDEGAEASIGPAEWGGWWARALTVIPRKYLENRELVSLLDDATRQLLATVSEVWPLQPLFDVLVAGDDLIVQVNDVLHAVPIAFLHTVGDKPEFLFEKVDSVRTIISPLLDEWLRKYDVPRSHSDEPGRIASVCWFEGNSPGEQFVSKHLHRMYAQLECDMQKRYEWWSAAGDSEEAPGHHDVLARGIIQAGDLGLALLTICAHGRMEPHGVQLGDGVWDGSEVWNKITTEKNRWTVRAACDLSKVDFLIQLSCSIGRVKQTGLQDVHGFCAELAINRARSVLAGRWPLHGIHSVEFADLVARAYLALHYQAHRDQQPLWQQRVRGRAVSTARRQWASDYRQGKHVSGLNAVAGLELFGLS